MTEISHYKCDKCGKIFQSRSEAYMCEDSHLTPAFHSDVTDRTMHWNECEILPNRVVLEFNQYDVGYKVEKTHYAGYVFDREYNEEEIEQLGRSDE